MTKGSRLDLDEDDSGILNELLAADEKAERGRLDAADGGVRRQCHGHSRWCWFSTTSAAPSCCSAGTPWCERSAQLMPQFAETTAVLRGMSSAPAFAKLDGERYPKAAAAAEPHQHRAQVRHPWNEVCIGKLLEDLVYALAGTIVVKHCSDEDSTTRPLLVVTAYVDKMMLKKPIRVDTDLKVAGAVTYVCRSSSDIQIEVTQVDQETEKSAPLHRLLQ